MQTCEHCRATKRAEEQKAALAARINRIIGQLGGVKKMIDEDRYCNDILIQLSAIEHSVKSLAGVVLEQHLNDCVVGSIQEGNLQAIDEIVDLFKRF